MTKIVLVFVGIAVLLLPVLLLMFLGGGVNESKTKRGKRGAKENY